MIEHTNKHGTALSPEGEVLEYTDELVEAVCNAWTIPGQHTRYHTELQRDLEERWPALAKAIKALVAGAES